MVKPLFQSASKPFGLLAALLLALLSGVACDSSDPNAQQTKPDILQTLKQAQQENHKKYIEIGDLPALQGHKQLRILLPRLSADLNFLPRKGFPVHQEAELINELAERLGLRPVWIFVDAFDQLIPKLLAGEGDLIAANLTVTESRQQQVAFSVPVATVYEQLVVRSDSGINSLKDLAGKTVVAQTSSSFWDTLQDIKKHNPKINIQALTENLTLEDILERLIEGKYDATVADSNFLESYTLVREEVQSPLRLTDERAVAWAVRPDNKQLLAQLNLFLNQEQLVRQRQQDYHADLDEIKQRKVLRVITRNNAASYFLWQGELLGFEYELVKAFAKHLGVRLEVVVVPNGESLQQWLLQGKGDMVAAALSIHDGVKEGLVFSRRYNEVSEILVSRADEVIDNIESLKGRSVHVRYNSSYRRSLQQLLAQGAVFKLVKAPESLETEDIIAMVASGQYDLTVADSHIVDMELSWRDNIKEAMTIKDGIEHGWLARKDSPKLLAAMNDFIKKKYRGLEYNLLKQKYFERPAKVKKLIEQRVDKGNGNLSPYDELVKAKSEKYGFDWRMITAQMFQESRFNPKAKSWVGAKGLMQVMPRTAREMGLTKLQDPAIGIEAGVRYMDWLRDRFDHTLSVKDRMWFALASYNAGLGHVKDARRLAKRKGWSPNKWFDNVEKAMLLLSKRKYYRKALHGYVRGREPVNYVRHIRDRYRAYVKLTSTEVASR